MRLDVVPAGDVNRTGLQITFCDSERILDFPEAPVNFNNFLITGFQLAGYNGVITVVLLFFSEYLLIGNEYMLSIIDEFTGGELIGEIFHVFCRTIGCGCGIGLG